MAVTQLPVFRDYETLPHLLVDTRIREITSRIIDVPTTRAHKLSNTEIQHQSYVHVSVLFENGIVGHGEAATLGGPRWSEESVEAIHSNIRAYLGPALINLPGCRVEVTNLVMAKTAKRNFAAKSAVNAAILDALGKTLDVHVATLLGGAVRTRFPAIWALASGDAGQEAEEAKAKIAQGQFNRFKIKLGFADPKTDLARLARLRRELPADTLLIADINQGWSEADCRRLLPALEDLAIALVEQPIDAEAIETLARVADRTRIPIMLDEAVFTATEAHRAVTLGAGQVLSLKLCKHGSAQELMRIAGIAAAGGLELYGGCLLESSLGAAAHLASFAALPRLEWGCEHFGPLILTEDTTTQSLVYDDYHVLLPDGPGLGVAPDPDRIARFERSL